DGKPTHTGRTEEVVGLDEEKMGREEEGRKVGRSDRINREFAPSTAAMSTSTRRPGYAAFLRSRGTLSSGVVKRNSLGWTFGQWHRFKDRSCHIKQRKSTDHFCTGRTSGCLLSARTSLRKVRFTTSSCDGQQFASASP